MCDKCKTNSPVLIKTKCLEIQFPITLTKSGSWKRTGDFSARELFDPDNYSTNEHVAICSNCGSEIKLSDQKITKSCFICSSTEIHHCAYNEMDFCLSCASISLRYCRTCPLRSNCELGELNVNRNP